MRGANLRDTEMSMSGFTTPICAGRIFTGAAMDRAELQTLT